MKFSVSVFAFLWLLTTTSPSSAQWKDPGSGMPTPNAAGLGLYGEVPVSFFTGVPDISVPLYTVKGNKIELPVELKYHASGLRPEMHPGWVGNGWSLSAGGVITRKINGKIDEYQRITQGIGKLGYYYNYSNLNSSSWDAQSRILAATVEYPEVQNFGNSPLPSYWLTWLVDTAPFIPTGTTDTIETIFSASKDLSQ